MRLKRASHWINWILPDSFLSPACPAYSPVSIRSSNQARAEKSCNSCREFQSPLVHGSCMSVACGGWMIAVQNVGKELPSCKENKSCSVISTTSSQAENNMLEHFYTPSSFAFSVFLHSEGLMLLFEHFYKCKNRGTSGDGGIRNRQGPCSLLLLADLSRRTAARENPIDGHLNGSSSYY
jgi:hypothetical protein